MKLRSPLRDAWLLIQGFITLAVLLFMAVIPYLTAAIIGQSWNPLDWHPFARGLTFLIQSFWALSVLNQTLD